MNNLSKNECAKLRKINDSPAFFLASFLMVDKSFFEKINFFYAVSKKSVPLQKNNNLKI